MRYQRAEQPLKLDGPAAARAFFASCFAESDPARECLWVAHLDDQRHCLHLARHQGATGHAPFPIRSIIIDAVHYGSTAILLAHNHPSDDCRPSKSDHIATHRLNQVAEAIDCRLVDHLIFGGTSFSSFRQLGLL
jgi:DNA repair protein RadC